MDFYSAYQQGFVRVAACTQHTALADPAANAESVLATARDCDADSVAVAVFPELTLSGYSIDDILMQDALLEAVHEALGAWHTVEHDLDFGVHALVNIEDTGSDEYKALELEVEALRSKAMHLKEHYQRLLAIYKAETKFHDEAYALAQEASFPRDEYPQSGTRSPEIAMHSASHPP